MCRWPGPHFETRCTRQSPPRARWGAVGSRRGGQAGGGQHAWAQGSGRSRHAWSCPDPGDRSQPRPHGSHSVLRPVPTAPGRRHVHEAWPWARCLCSSTRPTFVYAGSLPPHSSGLAPQLPLQADRPKLRKVGTRNVLLAREWQRLAERQSRASFPNLSCLTLLAANSETQPGPKSLGVCAKPTVPLGPAQTSPSLRPSAPLPAPTAPGQPGLPAPSPWRGPMGGGWPGCCQEPRPLLRAAAFAKICSLALKSSCDSTAERLVTVSSSWGPVCPRPAYGAGFGGERGSCDIGGR